MYASSTLQTIIGKGLTATVDYFTAGLSGTQLIEVTLGIGITLALLAWAMSIFFRHRR